MKCRHCGSSLSQSFVDLGSAPPSNSYLSEQQLACPELWLPLNVLTCQSCWLVQTVDFASPADLFSNDYAYFSSMSESWLNHSERYVTKMIDRFSLTECSNVIEVACNDGYLLQYVIAHGISALGIEPTASTAAAARERGIPVIQAFFGRKFAERQHMMHNKADLMVANNVLAHVPDINDFVGGFELFLRDSGVATFEFPYLLNLIIDNQFDTIYHEHYSYLSFKAVERIFSVNGLRVFDVEALPTHGGSLRVFAERADSGCRAEGEAVRRQRALEADQGIDRADFYDGFQAKAERVKDDFLRFLLDAKRDGNSICAYGAAAKGNTLLNFAGVRPDLLPFVVDRSPGKQGKFLPGSRIPIVSEERIRETRPDYIVILPWNLRAEIAEQLGYVRDWGGRFVTAVPRLEIF